MLADEKAPARPAVISSAVTASPVSTRVTALAEIRPTTPAFAAMIVNGTAAPAARPTPTAVLMFRDAVVKSGSLKSVSAASVAPHSTKLFSLGGVTGQLAVGQGVKQVGSAAPVPRGLP